MSMKKAIGMSTVQTMKSALSDATSFNRGFIVKGNLRLLEWNTSSLPTWVKSAGDNLSVPLLFVDDFTPEELKGRAVVVEVAALPGVVR